MTEEKLVERVTALFADSDAAQRKMIRLYAETNDAIEASAIIDSGAEVLHMLQGGLRPEVLVLDSVLSDTTIFPLLRSIRQQQIEYEPHIIVTLMPSAAPQIEKILTLGAECTIFKPYSLPELFDTVYQTAASGPRLNRYLVHESVTAQLRTLGCYKNLAYGINYLQEAVYIAVCNRQACSLGELCTKAGEPFGVNGPAVRSALERLNARLYKSNTPAYQMTLPQEYCSILRECAAESAQYERGLWEQEETAARNAALAAGCREITLAQEELERFCQLVQPLYEKYCSDYLPLVEEIRGM